MTADADANAKASFIEGQVLSKTYNLPYYGFSEWMPFVHILDAKYLNSFKNAFLKHYV